MKFFLIITSILIILTISILPVIAEEPEWSDPQEKTLRLEESIIRDKFLIEATSFFEDSVLITVYWKGISIDNNIMRINDSWNVTSGYVDDQEKIINITIKDFREDRGNISAQEGLNVIVDQWVKIETRMAGAPLPIVSIVPEEKHRNNRTVVNRVFGPYSEIPINFTIINNGKATLRTPILRINTSLPLLFSDDKLYHELSSIKPGENITVRLRFKCPYIGHVGSRTNFTISANVTGKDVFGRTYNDNETIYVIVKAYHDDKLELKKLIPERVYMGDIVTVSLNIKNNMFGFGVRNVTLTDTIPVGFEILHGGNGEIKNKDNISWNITLDSAEKTILYSIVPKRPGIYSLDNACIDDISTENMAEKICSDVPNKVSDHKIIASGPYVELVKSANKNINREGQVDISVYIKNKGDRSAIVKLIDRVPKINIVNKNNNTDNNNIGNSNNAGNNSMEISFDKIFETMIVRPQSTKLLNYSFTIDNNIANGINNDINNENMNYKLPPAKAIVLDQFLYQEDKYVQKVISNELSINDI